MKKVIKINKLGRTPIYKQIVDSVENAVRSGKLSDGEMLPSMNELATMLDVSKETVKKAYGILCKMELLEPRHGRGFFVRKRSAQASRKVLMLFDRLSPYRQAFVDSFSSAMGEKTQTTILLHNQSIELFKYYLDHNLGDFDYYVVTPHFPLDGAILKEVVHQLKRIPNRQLILADRMVDALSGNFGAVYQDYRNDAGSALMSVEADLRKYKSLDIFTMPNSLYGADIEKSICSFCERTGITPVIHHGISSEDIHANQVCVLLNSQADHALFTFNRIAASKGLEIGTDVKLISYNESPICELIFGGLSTLSADFHSMGRECARMICNNAMAKQKADFGLIRRKTF